MNTTTQLDTINLSHSIKKLVFFIVLFCTQLSFAQKNKEPQYYTNGQNGIQFIAQSKKGTVIVSNFNAKMTIREDIARKVYELYLKKKIKANEIITVNGKEAKVIGKFEIAKKGKLTNLNFYYQKVEWKNGLVEIYQEG
jgi:hypothetical protein